MRFASRFFATAIMALVLQTPARAQFTALPSPSPYGGFGGYGLSSGYGLSGGFAATGYGLGGYGLGSVYAPAYSYGPGLGNYGTGLGYFGTGQVVNPYVSYYYTPSLSGPSYVGPSPPYLGSLGLYDPVPFGYPMYQPTTNLIPAYGLYGAAWRQTYYQQRAAMRPVR